VELYPSATAILITAMRRPGHAAVIVISSGGVEIIPTHKPDGSDPVLSWVWEERGLTKDMQRMERIVHSSDMDATVLRPRTFVEGPLAQSDLKTIVGAPTPNPASNLTYADLAQFILAEVDDGKFAGQTVGYLYRHLEAPGWSPNRRRPEWSSPDDHLCFPAPAASNFAGYLITLVIEDGPTCVWQ